MGTKTAISWTDHTFNPWWGCEKISPACDHCYAESGAIRYGYSEAGVHDEIWGHDTPRRFLSDKNWAKPVSWNAAAKAADRLDLVFSGSYCDIFEARDDLDEARARLWKLVEETPNLIWQLLTKRPEQVPHRVPEAWMNGAWPANAGVGVTAEDQDFTNIRVPRLLKIPAPFRFLSVEPMFGHVDLGKWMPAGRARWYCQSCRTYFAGEHEQICPCGAEGYWTGSHVGNGRPNGQPIDWVIVGGESGAGHRPFDLEAAVDLRMQCMAAGVPFFFKQVGGLHPTDGGDELGEHGVVKEWPVIAERHRHATAVTIG